jgi:hypothetical protein
VLMLSQLHTGEAASLTSLCTESAA